MQTFKGFTPLFKDILKRNDISLEAKVLYGFLHTCYVYYTVKGGKDYTPSNVKLEKDTSIDRNVIEGLLSDLEYVDLIRVTNKVDDGGYKQRVITVL